MSDPVMKTRKEIEVQSIAIKGLIVKREKTGQSIVDRIEVLMGQ